MGLALGITIKCRAVCQRGLPVPLNHPCGVPIAVEGLGDVPLLSIPVGHQHVDTVGSGEELAGHSSLVHQRMVRIEVLSVWVFFVNTEVVKRLSARGGSLVCGSWVVHTKVGPFLTSSSDGSRDTFRDGTCPHERQKDRIHLFFLSRGGVF